MVVVVVAGADLNGFEEEKQQNKAYIRVNKDFENRVCFKEDRSSDPHIKIIEFLGYAGSSCVNLN